MAVKGLLSRQKALGLIPVTEENNSPKVTSDTQSHTAGVLTQTISRPGKFAVRKQANGLGAEDDRMGK